MMDRRRVAAGVTDRMIARRAMLRSAAASGLSAALGALAQQPAKLFRIGWLGNGAQAGSAPLQQVFIDGMREIGWVEGRHFVIEGLYADGHIDRLPALAAELV